MASVRVHELINLACATGCLMMLPGCQSDQRDSLAASASSGAESLKNGWNDLNDKVENLDPDSSMRDLEDARQKVAGDIEKWKDKADSGYEQAKLQLQRINAAERVKELRKELDDLQAAGKNVSQRTAEASRALEGVEKQIAVEQAKFDEARAKAAELLPQSQ